jgi:hypothetical protein
MERFCFGHLSDKLLASKLKCSDSESLKYHKFIFAARLPVVNAMQANNTKTVRQGFVEVSSFNSVVMKIFLLFI